MSNVYAGIGTTYWERSATISRGAYLLENTSPCEFGEPAVERGTGTVALPQNKKYVYSYPSGIAAGLLEVIGVFIEWRRAISTWDDEDMANW